jgi:ring-1,2-phenylacetyl-CoA epoxidase subunit PaaE
MSTPSFITCTIADIKKETADCVSIALNIPEQFKPQFNYQPGQYLTLKTFINGQEVRRSYSICSAPHEKELRVAIKKVDEGVFSTYANTQLKIGDSIDTMPPMGHFQLSEPQNSSQYLGIASGSGITPIISIIKHILNTEPNSTFTLIFGNKNLASIIFREEIEALKNSYMIRFNVIHLLSREHLDAEINYGRISSTKCEQLFDKLIDISKINSAYICGPEDMILDVKDFLIRKGMSEKKVKFELFGTKQSYKPKLQITEIEQGPKHKVSIKVDARTISFEVGEKGDNILDAALRNGADLPYACKGGVCCTCRAKLISGEVRMDVNYALEQDELDAGFILTCQAHPLSNEVIIDFDVS